MNAPDKIFIHRKDNPLEITWSETLEKNCSNECYIRKDALLELANNYLKESSSSLLDEGVDMAMKLLIDKLNSFMTNEDKQLLLKDLCGRLLHGVKVCAMFNTGNRYTASVTAICADRDYIQIRQNDLHPYTGSSVENIRPYLRPISSMTEEEKDELNSISYEFGLEWFDAETTEERYAASAKMQNRSGDFYNAHHIDHHGLIPMGLAIEAPEGMYKTK